MSFYSKGVTNYKNPYFIDSIRMVTRGPFHKSSYERFLFYEFVEPVLNYRSYEFVAFMLSGIRYGLGVFVLDPRSSERDIPLQSVATCMGVGCSQLQSQMSDISCDGIQAVSITPRPCLFPSAPPLEINLGSGQWKLPISLITIL